MRQTLFTLAFLVSGTLFTPASVAPVADAIGLPSVADILNRSGAAWAANIKRNKLKRRKNGLYRSVVVSEDRSDDESTASVDLDITYVNDDGESTTASATANAPRVERVYFDWTPPAEFAGGAVRLGCIDCGDDGFSDVPIVLGSEDGWDGDNEDIEDTTLSARAWLRGDGSYRFRLKGKPSDVSRLNFDADGAVPTASLTVDGEPTSYRFSRETWRTDLDVPAGALDEQVVLTEVRAYDADGTLVDAETRTSVPSDAVREGVSFDRIKLTENNDGTLELLATAFTDDPTHLPTLDFAAAQGTDIASALAATDAVLELESTSPTQTQFQFADTFALQEPDNFVDMTYIASIEAIDASGDVQLANFETTVVIGEGLEGRTVSGSSGDWQFAITTGLLENFETTEGIEDVGFVRVALSGSALPEVDRVVVRLTAEDGGSDLDDEGDDGEADTVETPFIGAWHTWRATGEVEAGAFENERVVGYSASVSTSGISATPLGERDINAGTTAKPGNVFNIGSAALYGEILISGAPIEYDEED